MRIIIILTSFLLIGCSSSGNLAKLDDKSTLSSGEDLIKTYSLICSEKKSTDKDTYSCGSGYSVDLDLSRSKAILTAKIAVADKISSTVLANQKEKITETSKDGLSKSYDSNSSSTIWETTLNRYEIVYDKSFFENGKYRSFVILKYSLTT